MGKKRLVTELVTMLVIDGKKGEPEGRIKDIRKPAIPCGLRVSLVEVTGFEPATFWSRKLTLFDQCESDYPSLSTIDRICSDRKAPSVGEFALQTTRLKEPAIMDNRFVISHRFSCSIPRVRCHA